MRTLKFVLWVPLSMWCHCISLKGKRRHAQGVKILDVQAAGPKFSQTLTAKGIARLFSVQYLFEEEINIIAQNFWGS